MSTKDVSAARRDVTVAVGVALCVVIVAIATIFVCHSSRHTDCDIFRFSTFKMAPSAVAPSGVVTAHAGNSSSAKLNTTTPSSGTILVHGRHQQSPGERRVVIGRSASRDCIGTRDDVTSGSTALPVSLNQLPLGHLLGPTNYIPYRLKQSYC